MGDFHKDFKPQLYNIWNTGKQDNATDSHRREINMAGPLKIIRAKCLDCSADSYAEVNRCLVKDCPLWSYRFGKRPETAARQGKDVYTRVSQNDTREASGPAG